MVGFASEKIPKQNKKDTFLFKAIGVSKGRGMSAEMKKPRKCF